MSAGYVGIPSYKNYKVWPYSIGIEICKSFGIEWIPFPSLSPYLQSTTSPCRSESNSSLNMWTLFTWPYFFRPNSPVWVSSVIFMYHVFSKGIFSLFSLKFFKTYICLDAASRFSENSSIYSLWKQDSQSPSEASTRPNLIPFECLCWLVSVSHYRIILSKTQSWSRLGNCCLLIIGHYKT